MNVEQIVKEREELVAKARALHPLLAKNADEAERRRRLPDENFKAIVDAGLLRILVPRRFGGYEAGHRTYLDVVAELARSGCGSTAWYAFILNMNDWLMGMLPLELQRTVYSDGPDHHVAASLNPSPGWKAVRTGDGVRLSGEWGYMSGCLHADWVMFAFPMLDDGGKPYDSGVALMRMNEVTRIKDDWRVAGMAGTGSNTCVLEDVYVSDQFITPLSKLLMGDTPDVPDDGYMYKADTAAVFWTCLCPPVIGLAQCALDLTLARMTARPKPVTYTNYADATKAPSVQAKIAEAATMIDAAVLQARAATDAIDEQSRNGGHFTSDVERHQQFMRTANAVRLCQRAVDLLLDVQGASAFALSNPMQRVWRDLATCSRHGFNATGIKQEIYGRSLFGAQEQQMTNLI